jgi:hypothetical protein
VQESDFERVLHEHWINRKYTIRLLNGPRPEKRRRPSRRRGVSYDQETLAVLMAVWEAAGYPWSVRLTTPWMGPSWRHA